MMINLICWWKGHNYNYAKYRIDLKDHYKINKNLLFKTRKEIEDFYNNHPNPCCLRCKEEIVLSNS